MSTTPSPLTVVMTDELTKKIQDAIDPADIKAKVVAELQKQQAEKADQAAADAAAKVDSDAKAAADAVAALVPTLFNRTVTINGRDFLFEGETELELERSINNALTVAAALTSETEEVVVDPAQEEAARAAAAKAAETQAAERAELELKFKRGEISAKEYIEKSGAISEYLEAQGIPLDDLKASVTKNRSDAFVQSWEQATDKFKNSAAGADWPGGERNIQQMGMMLAALDLVDADDKVDALAQAYAHMKKTGMIFKEEPATPVATPAAAVIPATATPAITVAPAAAAASAAPATSPRTSSSMFGASSGVGAGAAETKVKAANIEIPKDASPAEILAAWKEQTVKDGKSPDAAFIETFSARRA